MITVVNHMHVLPENAAEFEELMTYVAGMSNEHEPGVVYYAFAKSTDEADTYVVVEVYRDQAAYTAHGNTDWVQQSAPKSTQLIDGVPRIAQYASPGTEPVSGMADYSTRLRLDQPTQQRLDEVVAAGHYSSNDAAVVDAINRRWEQLRQEDLDAAYAAAVADNPSYPYESEAERAAARTRRNARQQSAPE
jgi:quinol monooxygenase YgiN/Arc/MetJ-type ribon-helix-helix transcriptional regulator